MDIKHEFSELITSFEFISQLKKDEKVSIKTRTVVSKDSWMGALRRYWYEQNRNYTLSELEELYSRCCNILIYLSSNQLNSLQQTLIQSQPGLNNLYLTYASDKNMAEKLSNIQTKFSRLQKIITYYSQFSASSALSLHRSYNSLVTVTRIRLVSRSHNLLEDPNYQLRSDFMKYIRQLCTQTDILCYAVVTTAGRHYFIISS